MKINFALYTVFENERKKVDVFYTSPSSVKSRETPVIILKKFSNSIETKEMSKGFNNW